MSRLPALPRATALSAALVAALAFGGCGGEAPWNEEERSQPAPATSTPAPSTPAPSTPAPAGTPPETGPGAGDSDDAPATQRPAPPSRKPLPGGGADAAAERQDRAALRVLRTMVSAVEGCRSGRQRYSDCDSHAELGEAAQLGARIGDGEGEAQITAGTDGFRITVRSASGAKFTVARSPSGERLKCVAGDAAGLCGADRRWRWDDAN